MSAAIIHFAEEHVGFAADLLVATFGRLLTLDPMLPPQWLERGTRASDIRAAAQAGVGVAAMDDAGLVGFLVASLDLGGPVSEAGWPSEASLGGARSAAIRIGWHAAEAREARTLYREMYAALAETLVAHGCFRHSISGAVCDQDAVDAWFGLGFGIDQVLGSRALAHLESPRPDLIVRRANPADIDALLELNIEGLLHHVGSPSFLPAYLAVASVRRDLMEAIGDPGRAVWLAEQEGGILGVMETTGLRRPSVNSARSQTGISIGLASVAKSA